MIDWNAPLEAVHADGQIERVVLSSRTTQPDHEGDYMTDTLDDGITCWFRSDGSSRFDRGWTIRNVVQLTDTTSPDQTHRMVSLIKRMAANNYMDTADYKDARAIAAELTEREDPRIAVVEEVLCLCWLSRESVPLAARNVLSALDGIRK